MSRPKEDRFATGELPDISTMKFAPGPPEPLQRSAAAPEPEEPRPSAAYPAEDIYSGNAACDVPRRSRRGVGCLVAVLLVLAIVAACAAGAVLFFRSAGKTTVLLAGTDADGDRTDTIMLASVDPVMQNITLMSIPRDTYVSREYSVPKINSAYGWVGGGQRGMEELAGNVEEITGLRPDCYILVSLDAFARAVDLMGGVDFNVPVDMYYEDPYQDLVIDLRAGMQHLDGEDALSLVRFRSGYDLADLTRVEVQRQFISEALRQWLTFSNVRKLPQLYRLFREDMVTDLSDPELIKLAVCLARCGSDSVSNLTIPGESAYIKGGSYFVVDSGLTPDVMERYFG